MLKIDAYMTSKLNLSLYFILILLIRDIKSIISDVLNSLVLAKLYSAVKVSPTL